MISACVFRSLTWAVQDASCCDVWSENSTLKSWWVWTSIHSSCMCTSLLSTPWLQTFWTQDKCLCLWSSCKVVPGHSTIHLLLLQLYERSSLVPRLPLLFYSLVCVQYNIQKRNYTEHKLKSKKWGDLGTRLREIKIEQWENMGTRLRWQVASSPLSIYSVFFFFLIIYNRVNSWTWCTTVKLWLNCMCWSVSCNR